MHLFRKFQYQFSFVYEIRYYCGGGVVKDVNLF